VLPSIPPHILACAMVEQHVILLGEPKGLLEGILLANCSLKPP